MGVVLDYVVAEHPPTEFALLKSVDRLGQCFRDVRQFGCVIGVAAKFGRRPQVVGDAVEPRSQGGRVNQVRIAVGARDAALDPQALA